MGSTSWGKKVSMVWSEPEDHTAARAELFVRLGAKEFPNRQRYYDDVPEALRPRLRLQGDEEEQEANSSDEDVPGTNMFGNRTIPISFILAHLWSQRDRAQLVDGTLVDDQSDEEDDVR